MRSKPLGGLGADIDATGNDGRTALIYAARNGHLDAIKTLAGLGADVNAANKQGETAWDLAKNDETRKTLEEARADSAQISMPQATTDGLP